MDSSQTDAGKKAENFKEANSESSANENLDSKMSASESQNEAPHSDSPGIAGEAADEMHENLQAESIKIEFPYSELIRAKVPKVFEVAEQVATDWVQDGQFESLPVENPLAQALIGKGLRKAKDLEKEVVKVVEANPALNDLKNQVIEKANVAKATIQILLKK